MGKKRVRKMSLLSTPKISPVDRSITLVLVALVLVEGVCGGGPKLHRISHRAEGLQ